MRTPEPLLMKLERYSTPEPNSGCWLWFGSATPKGYGRLNHGRKTLTASRASWVAHNGPIPDGLCVLHKCDTPACVNPAHLFLGTNDDNVADKLRKGRAVGGISGEAHHHAKLTSDSVRLIRSNPRLTATELAARLGVDRSTVGRVRNGKAWVRT